MIRLSDQTIKENIALIVIDFSRYMVLQETYAKVFEYEKRTGKIFGDEEE